MFALDLSPTGEFPFSDSFLDDSPDAATPSGGIALHQERFDSLRSSDQSPALERFAPAWSELLHRAVEEPGLICDAYTRFHGYSLGNRFAALIQCEMRGLEPGPLNSFNGWRKLGYGVKEGEKALTLCMPLKGTLHREKTDSKSQKKAPDQSGHPDVEAVEYIRAFVWKPSWFVLSQTVPLNENTPALPVCAPLAWDRDKALAALDITPVPFDLLDGNALGFARKRTVAVSPLSPTPFKTLFHELAHVVLGHTTNNFRGEGNTGQDLSDGEQLSQALIEVEAESVALLLLATLDLPGQEFCRGYIQHWAQGQDIPEKSAQRIFGAADRILAAGVGESRVRAPTAEEVGLTAGINGTAEPVTVPSKDVEANNSLPVAAQGLPPPPPPSALTAPTGLATARSEQVASANTEALGEPDSEVMWAPSKILDGKSSEVDAWALYGHLQSLHEGLHPAKAEDGQSFARALRHLRGHDPEAAREVQSFVKSASRGLKAAALRIEALLDGAPSGQGERPAPEDDSDPFAGMAPGEVRRGSAPKLAKEGETAALPLSEGAAPLSPTRQAAARRTVGRTLRSELEFERDRFLKAAKAHELPTGRKDEKEMLAAVSAFLGVPVTSRRDLSSHQWARCASAIETEDLLWGKPGKA